MRPVGGQEKIIATLPCSQAAHCATASRSLLPGIDALFWAIIWSSVVSPAGSGELRLHVRVEEFAAVGAELLQEAELVAGTAEFAEMRGAVDVGRQLVGDELRDLGIVVPGLRHAKRLAEFRLVGRLQLRIVEYVRAVVERELIAVVEHAPALALVQGDRLVERVIVVEVGLVHVFGDVVVDRHDDAAVGEGGDPGRLDVEDVVGAGIGDVLGDRLGILVGVRAARRR